jgi:SAM-dependent methyltransferase
VTDWEGLWQQAGTRRLWVVPDRHVVALVRDWKGEGGIRRVWDLGCGTGRHGLLLAREGFDVYVSDPSETAVRVCADQLRAENLDAQVWRGDVSDVPYRDEFFDAVIAFNSIYHGTTRDLKGAIWLLGRKLRPAGVCFVTLPSRRNRLYGKGRAVEPHTFISQGLFPQLFPHAGEQGIPHHFCSEDETRALFAEFELVSLTHEELSLPSGGWEETSPSWFRIPGAYFWHVLARRLN